MQKKDLKHLLNEKYWLIKKNSQELTTDIIDHIVGYIDVVLDSGYSKDIKMLIQSESDTSEKWEKLVRLHCHIAGRERLKEEWGEMLEKVKRDELKGKEPGTEALGRIITWSKYEDIRRNPKRLERNYYKSSLIDIHHLILENWERLKRNKKDVFQSKITYENGLITLNGVKVKPIFRGYSKSKKMMDLMWPMRFQNNGTKDNVRAMAEAVPIDYISKNIGAENKTTKRLMIRLNNKFHDRGLNMMITELDNGKVALLVATSK
jgi:hypothetical protein